MKIFILTQEDAFYLPAALHTVLAARGKDVVGMTILPETTKKKGWLGLMKEHYQLFGLRTFLYQSVRFAWYRGMDLVTRFVPLPGFYAVQAVTRHYRIPLYPTVSINSAAYLDTLRALAPDVVVSINASQVFKKQLLTLPPLGCINVHGAPLPKYRGRLPSFWALFNREQETGVTVHFMNEELDDGPIIAQRRVPIVPGETQHSLIVKTKRVGAELLLESLDRLEKGTVETRPNDRAQATYYSFPTPEDGQKFRRLGLRFI
ncbi:MAG: formyl transferase [Deltaproteobacteria bacterium]|nr:formyl transferase [Deltaproteobacteria bacterium]